MSEQPLEVTRERTLDAAPDEVWETLTDEVLLERWLAADVELELREGGRARFEFEDGETRHGRIERVLPHERLTFWWWAGDEEAHRVDFRLEPADGRTRLVVVETQPAGSAVGPSRWGLALSALASMHAGLVCA